MDWNERWKEEEVAETRSRSKWNYVFSESLKMALLLPAIVLLIEVFLFGAWPDISDRPIVLLFDYAFLFSVVFLVFVLYHLFRWRKLNR
ncbi:hypothetical protein QA596_08160 [Balneolales bacterium ANBcel1]|nr:hypothetical protein [Balneolales bacterium ANBcel1]